MSRFALPSVEEDPKFYCNKCGANSAYNFVDSVERDVFHHMAEDNPALDQVFWVVECRQNRQNGKVNKGIKRKKLSIVKIRPIMILSSKLTHTDSNRPKLIYYKNCWSIFTNIFYQYIEYNRLKLTKVIKVIKSDQNWPKSAKVSQNWPKLIKIDKIDQNRPKLIWICQGCENLTDLDSWFCSTCLKWNKMD